MPNINFNICLAPSFTNKKDIIFKIGWPFSPKTNRKIKNVKKYQLCLPNITNTETKKNLTIKEYFQILKF